MSVCGQSGQTEEDSASEEVGGQATRDIYKQKPASKVVRVLTVLAYLLSVSLAAILLSVYYICVWKSPELPLDATLNDTGEMSSARRSNLTDYQGAHDAFTPDYWIVVAVAGAAAVQRRCRASRAPRAACARAAAPCGWARPPATSWCWTRCTSASGTRRACACSPSSSTCSASRWRPSCSRSTTYSSGSPRTRSMRNARCYTQ
ncbi:unnamed protein product [Chrysodeixis includens]|uniref:InaF motif containing 2 n=1 Tax=Chrysodeixis includens TaxID=689277 RepID=A0A9N8Q037_CHRIL|nr:unnamed protein product [Chrysodeixis includens]